MRKKARLLVVLLLGAVLASPAGAQASRKNIDVIIAFDKSLSMVDKVAAVRDWVNTSIVDQLLIPGDYLVVVAFYGQAQVIVSRAITADADKATVKALLAKISGNGRFTDIGNALDALKAEAGKREGDGRDKYVLLLTDGKQEAPPGSRYYSKDGTFNHELLQNAKTIPEQGWKVVVLGIGGGTAAQSLAADLQGAYAQVPANPTAAQIAESSRGVFATTALEGSPRVSPIRSGGSSSVELTLRMSGPQSDASIVVSGVTATVGSREVQALAAGPMTLNVRNGPSTRFTIPLQFPTDLPPGSSTGTLAFSFSSAATFSPSTVSVPIAVNTPLQNNLIPLGAGAVLALLVIAGVVVLVLRLAGGKPVRFAVEIDGEPVGDDAATLAPGRQLFLNDVSGVFSLVARRSARSIAAFMARKGLLALTVLKQDRFPKLKEVPDDARGRTFAVKSENGRSVAMKVRSSERK